MTAATLRRRRDEALTAIGTEKGRAEAAKRPAVAREVAVRKARRGIFEERGMKAR
jgi:hypothetical protein